MIKAVTRSALGPAVIVGLSEENMKRLRNSKPVMVPVDKFGFGLGVVIVVYGETPEESVEAVSSAKERLEIRDGGWEEQERIGAIACGG